MKRIIFLAPALALVLHACAPQISSYEECIEAGFPIMESYPQKCSDGKNTFTKAIGNELEKMGLIKTTAPRPSEVVSSPLELAGYARGYWFFEANFPVMMLDEDGTELGRSFVTAQDDWMTEDFVEYRGTFDFGEPKGKRGTLVLKKANMSDLPENDDELRVPVLFEK